MDPPSSQQLINLTSPSGSRVNLPALLAGAAGAAGGAGAAEGILSALGSPPLSGPPTGSDSSSKGGEQRREVFSDLRRFVTFGLRKDTA